QPFGGWKRSAIGQTAKAGGPNYLVHLMDWSDADGVPDREQDAEAWLAAARHSDREQWASTFIPRDAQELHGEINVLRHLPLPVMVRAAEGTSSQELQRVLHAAATVDADVEVSVASGELASVARAAGPAESAVSVEDAAAFAARVPALQQSRIRLLGESDPALRTALTDRIEIALFTGEVVVDGRVELLPFLHEQAISATNHRFGNPLPHSLDLTGGQGWARGRA
ncbi:MAG: 1-pyrroline-5-carboxylate dehydrogenase, partial [Brachybacterium sp.]|nr:1-pyrroline-5-carboxylate dehydrogenase [Brachybacterium sp.]